MLDEKSSIRAFFAIIFNDEVKKVISSIIEELQVFYSSADIRWIKPSGLHITLQFLKQIPREDVLKLCDIVKPRIAEIKLFNLEFGKLELFPNDLKPKVISLQVASEESLAHISRVLADCLKEVDFPVEQRTFRAHITLGRFNFNTARSKVQFPSIELPPLPLYQPKEIVLFQSQPRPEASQYLLLDKFFFESDYNHDYFQSRCTPTKT